MSRFAAQRSALSRGALEFRAPPVPARVRQPVSHDRVIVGVPEGGPADPAAARGYCFSYTATLFTCCPLALPPFVVTVLVFPSADTTEV